MPLVGISVVLGVRSLVGMVGLLVWGMLALGPGLSARVLPPVAAWSLPL